VSGEWVRWPRGRSWSKWHLLNSRGEYVACNPRPLPAGVIRHEAEPDRADCCKLCLSGAIQNSQPAPGQRGGDVYDMVVRGTIKLADGSTRVETMEVGRYMTRETWLEMADAYVRDDEAGVNAAMNRCLTEEYMPGNGPVELLDVEWITGL
jgi:hypothetical protein